MTALHDSPWISSAKPNPRAALRLICFPYAGGGAAIFRGWSNDLVPEVAVYSAQLPGREMRLAESTTSDINEIVIPMAESIGPCLQEPFAFFGHSMGALLAFELARVLRMRFGLRPVQLFLSARRAPQLPNPDPPLAHLPEAAFIAEVNQRYNNSIPNLILTNTELRDLFLPILRADLALLDSYCYTHQEPLDCPIAVFGGTEDRRATVEQLEAWRVQTQRHFSVELFPGGHFFLQESRALLLRSLAVHLRRLIGEGV